MAVWSSHRIMEWLRSIDLSEYAPNLRGSGVHGALILYENAFNADLFATLLSIPASKTLLRRHISSKFKQLIGDHLSKTKHEYELMPNYQPLIPGAKIKVRKFFFKFFFSINHHSVFFRHTKRDILHFERNVPISN